MDSLKCSESTDGQLQGIFVVLWVIIFIFDGLIGVKSHNCWQEQWRLIRDYIASWLLKIKRHTPFRLWDILELFLKFIFHLPDVQIVFIIPLVFLFIVAWCGRIQHLPLDTQSIDALNSRTQQSKITCVSLLNVILQLS